MGVNPISNESQSKRIQS